jgi:ornithine cyclodeaminase
VQIVDRPAVEACMSWGDALAAAWQAFCALADGVVDQPAQLEMRPDGGGELHIKGAYLQGSSALCFKVATGGFPGAAPTGFTVVLDAATGAPRWLLDDGGLLTEVRTAAAGALASATLARPDARRLLVVGTGGQARAQVHAHREALPHLDVAVWGRDRAKAAAMAADVGAELAGDLAAAVSASDIVVTATSSRMPLIDVASVRPGTHLTAVGSDTAGKQELAAALLARAEVVVCDDVSLAAHAGELQHAGTDVRDRAVTLGDVLTERVLGRTSDEQISVADLCGLGIQDATIAERVAARLLAGTDDR